MTCHTTVLMGHETCKVSRHRFLALLQFIFELIILYFFAESSLDHDFQVSGSHPRLSNGNLRFTTRSWTASDVLCTLRRADLSRCTHLSHAPNFERQSRVSARTFRTHMHGSHRIHGELIDRYKTNDHTQPALFCVFTPGLEESQLFSVHIWGHQCRRRTAQTDRASFVSNSANVFLFAVPTTDNVVTPFSAVAHSSGFHCPFLCFCFVPCSWFLFLSLLLTQQHSIGISQNSAALRSEVPVPILDKLDMRVTRSVVRATTPEYDLKTNLNSGEFP